MVIERHTWRFFRKGATMNNTTSQRQVRMLEDRLSELAFEWRSTQVRKEEERVGHTVRAYHAIVEQLWLLGWDANLDASDELPEELMPQSYLTYWKKKNG